MKRICLWVFLIVALTAVAASGEVPPVTVGDFAQPEAHWFWRFLAADGVASLWLWVTTTGVGLIVGWLKWQGSRKERALLCLAAGVRETYEHYVRHVKQASADGKLTDAEREEAVRQAIAHAKQYAATEGFDLLKVLAKELIPLWVDEIVRRFKREGTSAGPLAYSGPSSQPPLPDLSPSLSSVM
ncbi:MAG: hypothetical protein LUE17_13820 [Planctomycetaceae bacterium]|nr:hypothetical protein [Planctomycetaceae bacterium]